jgi:DNA replication and repair protein RecF
MSFVELTGKNVRNLKAYKITPSQYINIFAGKNGAGKTNVLESIYLNALGRSFRTSVTRNLVADNEDNCWVFAHYQSNSNKTGLSPAVISKIGVERKKGNQQKLSINGVHHTSLAELALLLPILAIQPTETHLVDGSSSSRRKYLDWLLFHVEPKFLDLWRDNQRILKQRNLLLRGISKNGLNKSNQIEIQSWDYRYIETSQQVSDLRKLLSKTLNTTTREYLTRIPAFKEDNELIIHEEYYQGWSHEKSLPEALKDGLQLDLKRGFTRLGAHRCDLVIKANHHPAKDFLSRGQKKLLAMVMRLSQAKVLQELTGHKAVLLLDDLFAELDEENVKAFITLVEELDTQVFLTCLHSEAWVKDIFTKETQVFHVKHGEVIRV